MKTTTMPTPPTTAQHTPGKWSVQREFDHEPIYVIAPHSGETIATIERNAEGDPSCDLPNARLIAAAPDLLTSLRRLYEATYGRTDLVCQLDFEQARAAIAKAINA